MSLQNKSGFLRAANESDGAFAKREAAAAKLANQSMPTGREEVWRYVDLEFSLDDYELAAVPAAAPSQPISATPFQRSALWLPPPSSTARAASSGQCSAR